jgi:hypothetical protein
MVVRLQRNVATVLFAGLILTLIAASFTRALRSAASAIRKIRAAKVKIPAAVPLIRAAGRRIVVRLNNKS